MRQRIFELKSNGLNLYDFLICCSSLTIRNGIRRVESGEYEEHNNQKVFVVRGFFEHITNDVSEQFPTEFQNLHETFEKLLLFFFIEFHKNRE